MTASEFAFLALGLVLGVATGAALVEVLRARPPSRHQVRVTVAPNAIPPRRSSTLADQTGGDGSSGPARGGPADRRWVDRDPTEGGRRPTDPVPVLSTGTDSGADRVSLDEHRTSVSSSGGLGPFRLASAGGAASIAMIGAPRPLAGIPITGEPDPMMAALRAATSSATAAMRRAGGIAMADRGDGDADAPPRSEATEPRRPAAKAPTRTSGKGPAGPPTAPEAIGDPDGAESCADERRVADERCAVALRARDGARAAMETLRAAQREYDEHVSRADSETAAAEPRGVRAAKESAHQAFRQARSSARSREAVEAAAREWLTEINRINQQTREAGTQAERHRAAAAALAQTLEQLSVEADAARISAESAEEACVAAREALAACEETAAVAAAAARTAAAGAAGRAGVAEPSATPVAAEVGSMASRAADDAAIIRLLRGDHEVLGRIVAKLGGDDEAERRRWQLAIGRLLEALVARAIEASAFDFPSSHPFWGPFTQSQCRDIVAALSSLGYRHDGFGGWADDRVPGQRDLSLAVGYAGLDPMRIRHWPSEAESTELMREVTVAADEYVWEAAGTLTLGELISLLGRRADALLDLWNEWGTVRPLLLSEE